MRVAESRITAQGQISVPLNVRRKLGIGPGSLLEWDEEDGKIVVKRSGTFSSEDIHAAVFAAGTPKSKTIEEMKAGLRRRARDRYACR
jgi:antitoxin PrlF